MLFRLEIENFYSIRERQVVDLSVAANAPELEARLVPAWQGADFRVPKVVAIFGPNAAGKSNALRALSFLAWFVKDSFSLPPGNRLAFDRFNETSALNEPTRLAVWLGGAVDPSNTDNGASECAYMYEVVFGGTNDNQHVLREALFYWPSGKKTRLFERNENVVSSAKAFDLAGHRQSLEAVLRPNVSVVSTLVQLKHPFATAIWHAVSQVVSNMFVEKHDGLEDQMLRYYAANASAVEALNRELERIDVGLQSMEIVPGTNGPTAMFSHVGLTHKMPLTLESYGTRQFIKVFPALWYALQTGGIAILDELDTAIHPLVLPEIVRWFFDKNRNPHDAQLWMSCHNASLLEELAKEEILFAEKDSQGQTRLYGLRDVRAVRRADNYYKKYMGGVYGAVPNIG